MVFNSLNNVIFNGYAAISTSRCWRLSKIQRFCCISKRLARSIKKLKKRLTNYEEATPAYLALKKEMVQTEIRFAKYSKQGLLCGSDGLPHLVADGRPSHAGEFVLPVILFIYIFLVILVSKVGVTYNILKLRISLITARLLLMYQ